MLLCEPRANTDPRRKKTTASREVFKDIAMDPLLRKFRHNKTKQFSVFVIYACLTLWNEREGGWHAASNVC